MAVLDFESVSPEHAVLGLFDYGSVPSIFVTNPNRRLNPLRRPLTSPPIKSQPIFNHIMHRPTSLFQTRFHIRSMTEHDIDVVKL